jgi:Flp pilus assembly secretin CpaC
MTLIPTVKEFLGYDEDILKSPIATPLPHFRVRQMVCSVAIRDGQTVVLAGGSFSEEIKGRGQAETPKRKAPVAAKSLLVFVTPTLIDPAGDRLHATGESTRPGNR